MKYIQEKDQQGITLYLAIITLSAVLVTSLSIASALVKEYKISNDLANSLRAVYVADSVTEYTLFQTRSAAYTVTALDGSISIPLPNSGGTTVKLSCPVTGGVVSCSSPSTTSLTTMFSNSTISNLTGIVPTGGTFSVKGQLIAPGSVSGCSSGPNCVYLQASGGYGGTNRAMEIIYENK